MLCTGGMYNIPPTTTELPQNAGAPSSSYGLQVVNVFSNISYDGPCPPPGVWPHVHHYAFTVYALDTTLSLPGSANFPATALTLFRSLVKPGTRTSWPEPPSPGFTRTIRRQNNSFSHGGLGMPTLVQDPVKSELELNSASGFRAIASFQL